MTLDEFFEALPKDGWRIEPGGFIRRPCNGYEECPLTAVANIPEPCLLSPGDYADAGDAICAEFDISDVAQAADNDNFHDEVRTLRRRLLDTLNLEESHAD